MFYINDIDGPRFKGTLEELMQKANVSRKLDVRPLKEEDNYQNLAKGGDSRALQEYQKHLARDKGMVEPLVHAHQIMSSPVLTIRLDTLLIDAWNRIEKESVKQLVVTDDQRKVLGMLTERNILERINIIDNIVQDIHNIPVGDVISRQIVSTHAISDIRRIAKVLAKFHIDALPVIENELLIGIVTRGDILRGFAENPKLNYRSSDLI